MKKQKQNKNRVHHQSLKMRWEFNVKIRWGSASEVKCSQYREVSQNMKCKHLCSSALLQQTRKTIIIQRKWGIDYNMATTIIDFMGPVYIAILQINQKYIKSMSMSWLTEVIKTVITGAVAQYRCRQQMSNNMRISISTCCLSSRSARLWSISTKINQKRNFNFASAVLIRGSSQLWVTTWVWTEQSILYVLKSTENSFHYHQLVTMAGVRKCRVGIRSNVLMFKGEKKTRQHIWENPDIK